MKKLHARRGTIAKSILSNRRFSCLDFFLFGSIKSEAGISSAHVCSPFSAMIVLIPRWYVTWSLKEWRWKREVSCSFGACGEVKSGVWSLECGVWRNAGREMGMALLCREDLLKEHAKFQMKSSPNYFVVSISISIAPTANFAPIQFPISGPTQLDRPGWTCMLLQRWLLSVAQGNPGSTKEG
jgi:hypothetical protein